MPNQSLSRAESRAAYHDPHPPLGPMRDARRAVRYALRTEVVFSWSDDGKPPRECRGFTRDISPRGAYVVAASCPPPGASVAMSFFLPTFREHSEAIQVHAQSRVLRIDLRGAERCAGFSVENERTRLCKSEI